MNELIKTNQNSIKKEVIGQYVHDMMDLELRVHSLRELVRSTQNELNGNIKQTETEYQEVKNKREAAYVRYREMEIRETNKTFFRCFKDFYETGIGKVIGCVIPLCILGWFILIVLEMFIIGLFEPVPDDFSFSSFLIFIWIALGVSMIAAMIGILFALKKLFDDSSLQESKEFFKREDRKLDKAKEKYDSSYIYINNLRERIKELNQNIAKIETALQKSYNLNIIPPDYRRLECLVWIDYAFRNDQVDTMREATLQCDKWVRHKEFEKAMRALAEEIRSIAVLWEETNANIAQMTQEIYSISKSQKAQISESKSARYAMESVQKSTEKLAQYEEMRRWGSF